MPRMMPDTKPQRVLAASSFIYTVGSGLHLTAGVLYFTGAVHLPANQVGLGIGIADLVALALGARSVIWRIGTEHAASTRPPW
ncbi:hypothetical protein [Streptomyces roseochromogenus]|uniref:Uncharacterized protein n=1 Tax=Streptomyces roseochromogenus subsp. oscitans DS 12.976 TaxID=1352936 RepID=V6KX41_STRRC|nr:hypothetical protein [Streptomyces roseochromogenus]EST36677.1 hypothetical protein M878_00860 [Streptomyces roseochromogenus subsp. oscitans DS 12.976]